MYENKRVYDIRIDQLYGHISSNERFDEGLKFFWLVDVGMATSKRQGVSVIINTISS